MFLYAGLWLVLPADSAFETAAPGIEGATRGGRRPGRIRRLTDVGPAVVLAALGVGAVLLVDAVFGQGVAVLGGAARRRRHRAAVAAGRRGAARALARHAPAGSTRSGWCSAAAAGRRTPGSSPGVALIVGALVLLSCATAARFGLAGDVAIVSLLAVAGIGIVVGPWIYRLAADLTAERAERVRTQDRADVAAHLHDSVLQTLALIQKNSHDAPLVARLARVAGARPARLALLRGVHRREHRRRRAARGRGQRRGRPRRGRRARRRRRPALRRAADPGGAGHRRGDHQRRQARRRRPGRRLRRGHRRGGRRVRARPRRRVRPVGGRRTTATAYATPSATGWPATAGPPRSAPSPARAPRCGCTSPRCTARSRETTMTSDTSPATPDRSGSCSSTTTRCSAPASAASSPAPRWSRWSARPATSTRRSRAVTEHRPDVVLLDVHLPGGGGVDGDEAAPPSPTPATSR